MWNERHLSESLLGKLLPIVLDELLAKLARVFVVLKSSSVTGTEWSERTLACFSLPTLPLAGEGQRTGFLQGSWSVKGKIWPPIINGDKTSSRRASSQQPDINGKCCCSVVYRYVRSVPHSRQDDSKQRTMRTQALKANRTHPFSHNQVSVMGPATGKVGHWVFVKNPSVLKGQVPQLNWLLEGKNPFVPFSRLRCNYLDA